MLHPATEFLRLGHRRLSSAPFSQTLFMLTLAIAAVCRDASPRAGQGRRA